VGGKVVENLQASIAWKAGTWDLVVLNYGPSECGLFVDGQWVAQGAGVGPGADLTAPTRASFTLGSDGSGGHAAEAQLEEVITFDRPLSAREVADYYQSLLPLAQLGPITPEEEAQRRQQPWRRARLARAWSCRAPGRRSGMRCWPRRGRAGRNCGSGGRPMAWS
jgi:hypothetical protein